MKIEHNVVEDGGIVLDRGGGSVVRRNLVTGRGICVCASGNLIERNVLRGGGILLADAGRNVIRQNSISGGVFGILAGTFTGGNEITENVIADNSDSGIRIFGDSQTALTRIERNLVYRNGDGIFDGHEGSSVIAENRVYQNRQTGITIHQSAFRFQVLGNRVSASGGDGILVRSDTPTGVIQGNAVTRNGDDGIDDQTPGNTVTHNRATKNVDFGIEAAPGVIDGGGNRAFGNGNPLQCLNVGCK